MASQVTLIMVASRAIVVIAKLSRRAGRVCTSAHALQPWISGGPGVMCTAVHTRRGRF